MSTAIELQPHVVEHFEHIINEKRLAHAYLFEGSKGVGKKEVALWIAEALFCLTPLNNGAPCERCTNCLRIKSGNHPDVLHIEPDGNSIKVAQVRELKVSLTQSAMESSRRVVIVESADTMTTSAANGLLKFIEEPEGETFLFLLTELKNKMLPTVLSRCQVVHFPSISAKALETSLKDKGFSEKEISRVSSISKSVPEALALLENEWFPEAYDSAESWVNLLLDNNTKSFLIIQTQIVPLFKEKEQQLIFFNIVLNRLKKELYLNSSKTKLISKQIELVLNAQQKFAANVSFQAVCEQLVLQVTQSSFS